MALRSQYSRSSYRRSSGGGAGSFSTGDVLQFRTFYADQLGIATAAHPITAIAPNDLDGGFPAWTIMEMDQTIEQGRYFYDVVPSAALRGADAASLNVRVAGKAGVAPGVASVVELDLYLQRAVSNAASPAFSVIAPLGQLAIPTNAFWQYSALFVIPIATLGALAGEHINFQIVRTTPGSGVNLAGDFHGLAVDMIWRA